MVPAYELPEAIDPVLAWAGAIVVISGAVVAIVKLYRYLKRRINNHIAHVAKTTVQDHEGEHHGPRST